MTAFGDRDCQIQSPSPYTQLRRSARLSIVRSQGNSLQHSDDVTDDVAQTSDIDTRVDCDSRNQFARLFRDDPFEATRWLTLEILLRKMNAEEAVSIVLPYLPKASYGQRNLLFNVLMDFADPKDILYAAFLTYDRCNDSRLLRIAADLIGHYGEGATAALTRLARSDRTELPIFFSAISSIRPTEQRKEAIVALTKHSNPQVREELLAEADSMEDAELILRSLASDPNEAIRVLAIEKLEHIGS